MRRSGLTVVLATAALGACGQDTLVLHVPFREGDRAAIVVVEQSDRKEAFAIDASMRDATPILKSITGFRGSPSIRVTALFFTDTLSDLNISRGAIQVQSGQPSIALGTLLMNLGIEPAGIQRTVIEGDGGATWGPVEGLDREIFDLPVLKRTKCRRFETTRFDLPEDEPYAAGLFRIDDESALLIAYPDSFVAPNFYRVTLDGGPQKIAPLITDSTARVGTSGPDGRVWIAGVSLTFSEPRLFNGTLDGGFRQTPVPINYYRSLSVPKDSARDAADIYALSESGSLDRLENGEWRNLGALPPGPFGGFGDVVWLDREELLVSAVDRRALYRYKDGLVRPEDGPFVPDLQMMQDLVTAIEYFPDFGAFVGLDSGYIYRNTGSGWLTFMPPLIAQHSIFSFTPFHDGLVIGGDTGALQQWYPDQGSDGFCKGDDVVFLGNDADMFFALEVDGGMLAGGVSRVSETAPQQIFVSALREVVE